MNADRETNRLPLRAGAMLLLAIAVVFLVLGIREATKGGQDPEAGLKAAAQSAQAAASSTSKPAPTSASASAPASAAANAAGVPKLCVLNAGSVSGLANEVGKTLGAAGFDIGETGNLSTASINENTIFYTAGQEDSAKKVAAAVPGGASPAPRPAAFTRCSGELAVVVVSR